MGCIGRTPAEKWTFEIARRWTLLATAGSACISVFTRNLTVARGANSRCKR